MTSVHGIKFAYRNIPHSSNSHDALVESATQTRGCFHSFQKCISSFLRAIFRWKREKTVEETYRVDIKNLCIATNKLLLHDGNIETLFTGKHKGISAAENIRLMNTIFKFNNNNSNKTHMLNYLNSAQNDQCLIAFFFDENTSLHPDLYLVKSEKGIYLLDDKFRMSRDSLILPFSSPHNETDRKHSDKNYLISRQV